MTTSAARSSLHRLVGCLDVGGAYKPGDAPPTGYTDWHEWARIQHKAGLRQRRCGKCSLWKYPQEMSDQILTTTATTRKYGGDKITLHSPVCKDCAANAQALPLRGATKKENHG